MFYRLKKIKNHLHLKISCSNIYKAKPIVCDKNSSTTLVTMLSHEDLTMYLIAIQSIFQYLPTCKVVALNDGTLTTSDLKILNQSIIGIEVIPITHVKNATCPKGGCWERLLYISERVQDGYVLQIDSDIIVNGNIAEVIESIRSNQSFFITGNKNASIEKVALCSERAKTFSGTHVQTMAERALCQLDNASSLYYCRGCAAFAGFGKNSFSRSDVEKFSLQMEQQLGKEKWFEWGSEQVASNFVISNSQNKMVLPYPKHTNYWPNTQVDYTQSSVIHFMGTNRFAKGLYIQLARQLIQKLLA